MDEGREGDRDAVEGVGGRENGNGREEDRGEGVKEKEIKTREGEGGEEGERRG